MDGEEKKEETTDVKIDEVLEQEINDAIDSDNPETDDKIDDSETDEPEDDQEETDDSDDSEEDSEDFDDADTDDESEDETEDDDSESDSTIDDGLLEAAVKAGMSLADAKAFTDKGQLQRMVDLLGGKSKSSTNETSEEMTIEQILEAADSLPEINADEYDKEIAGAFSQFKNIIGGMANVIKGLQAESLSANATGMTAWLDSQVMKLGEDYVPFLGAGDKASLAPGSNEFVNRGKVVERMDILKAGFEATGKDVPSDEELFQDAVSSLFGSEVKTNRVNKDLKKRQSQHINRADKKKSQKAPKSVEDETAELIDAKYGV